MPCARDRRQVVTLAAGTWHRAGMPLSPNAVRVLGALLEKERTTPDIYPLSLQALTAACNQKTARDPVTALSERDVQEAMQMLRDRGLAATVHRSGDRVPKHQQRFSDAAGLDAREAAVMAVLMLRGPQTSGELRTRTERYAAIPDVATVESILAKLADRRPPMVTNRGRAPGQSQDRWAHTLGADDEALRPRARPARDATAQVPADDEALSDGDDDRWHRLNRRIDSLEARVAALEGTVKE